jgi:lipopolysaccharide/colanic/teichoic acid biosynthesis glycosyltransferase
MERKAGGMSRNVKRMLDIAIALDVLIWLSPLIGIIALAIRLTMGRPVLFRQTRPGYRARPFVMVKFRTMTNERGPDGQLLPIELRTTRLGSLLRSKSLDELPELWNVLKGDMSLIGPRPLLMEYLPRYTPEQARRHEVRPGLTGWAQVHGRHLLDWDKRFALDVWYVDHWSLRLDVEILAMTMRKVATAEGAGMGAEPPPALRGGLQAGQPDS